MEVKHETKMEFKKKTEMGGAKDIVQENSYFIREEMGKEASHIRAASKRRIQGVRLRGPALRMLLLKIKGCLELLGLHSCSHPASRLPSMHTGLPDQAL